MTTIIDDYNDYDRIVKQHRIIVSISRNSLPDSVVSAESVNSFKSGSDKCCDWNWNWN